MIHEKKMVQLMYFKHNFFPIIDLQNFNKKMFFQSII